MAQPQNAPPVLSTPDTHILADTTSIAAAIKQEVLSDDQLEIRYEISRTVTEIRQNQWRRVALQFPDDLLTHSARVYQMLARGLKSRRPTSQTADQSINTNITTDTVSGGSEDVAQKVSELTLDENPTPVKLTILADTSYGSCCVDEVAAEHVDADVLVHYGRACLSPTARLPVIHVYTRHDLDYGQVMKSFKASFPDQSTQVIVTADMPYVEHVQPLCAQLADLGYHSSFAASIVHNPSSLIPNRTLPPSVIEDPATLNTWHLFHISDPPTSLLLTLQSRMASIVIQPTSRNSTQPSIQTSTLLRRRYALLTSLTTTQAWGILINTLSVSNYLSIVSHVQNLIAKSGRRSYLFVVGKINPAKLANFSEIGGWVVIGCWESSLIDSKDFYRPIITPFELELAVAPDNKRLWSGEWRGDFEGMLQSVGARQVDEEVEDVAEESEVAEYDGENSESEDEPPEFDLRTGRYVSKPKPQRQHRTNTAIQIDDNTTSSPSAALVKRADGHLMIRNGLASPAAKYLQEQRTWRGLGSDFEVRYEDEQEEGSLIDEGQTGIARGYAVGEAEKT